MQFALDDQAHKGSITYSQASVPRPDLRPLPDCIGDAATDADANAVPRIIAEPKPAPPAAHPGAAARFLL